MTTFTWIVPVVQIIIALGLINVWLVRFKKPTAYRGGSAQNMMQEFATYGLPTWFMYVVGFLKLAIAIIMIVTVLVPNLLWLGVYAAAVLAVLMLGAIVMHIKVRDGLKKMLPATGMLAMAIIVIIASIFGMPKIMNYQTSDTMNEAMAGQVPIGNIISDRYVTMNPDQIIYSTETKTILFFAASWCPSCRILDRNILQNMTMIPADVTIIKVDYDTATELKKRYGITRQHTLVQVNETGESIHTWSGGSTLTSLLGQIK